MLFKAGTHYGRNKKSHPNAYLRLVVTIFVTAKCCPTSLAPPVSYSSLLPVEIPVQSAVSGSDNTLFMQKQVLFYFSKVINDFSSDGGDGPSARISEECTVKIGIHGVDNAYLFSPVEVICARYNFNPAPDAGSPCLQGVVRAKLILIAADD